MRHAAAALALAQKNKETADKNLVLAAKNEAIALENAENDAYNKKNELKPGDAGYRPPEKMARAVAPDMIGLGFCFLGSLTVALNSPHSVSIGYFAPAISSLS